MGLFDRFSKTKRSRMIVLGLDGMPYSFLMKETGKRTMPNLTEILEKGSVRPMNSTIPPISSVAWATFQTGRNPAAHNIFGFVDRNPGTMSLFIPTAKNMKSPTLWEQLSNAGKRVVVANVPVTFPPKEVNGILVGCFLSTELEKAVYPLSFLPTLKQLDYRIDVDAWEAHSDLDKFLASLYEVLDRRFRALNYFYEKTEWDFLMVHIMETDRLYHFYWEYYENPDSPRHKEFIDFHKRLDQYLGEFLRKVREDDDVILLSDHGFCTLKKEVNLNVYLRDKGLLQLREGNKGLETIDSSSKAYSLIPGRVFVNLKGREAHGTVEPGKNYEDVREEVIQALQELKEPETGTPVFESVYRREEIYRGPYIEQAADVIGLPRDGYDVKGGFKMGDLWTRDKFVGTHTYLDAFVYVKGEEIKLERTNLVDLVPTILNRLGVMIPPEMEGKNLLS